MHMQNFHQDKRIPSSLPVLLLRSSFQRLSRGRFSQAIDILCWIILCCGACAVHCSIPGLHPLDVNSTPLSVTIKNVIKYCQMYLGDKIAPTCEPISLCQPF